MNQTDILDIANWFRNKDAMTPKKLQKLCYYSVAWGWALMNRSIAQNSEFQAWVHGPASPLLYQKYKRYGWNDVPKLASAPKIPDDVNELLEAVWVTYGDKSGNELEALSHSEKPWVEARQGLASSESSTKAIKPNTMRTFYNSIKSSEY